MIQNFNNKTQKVWEDLQGNIKRGARLNVAAAIFSIYGFDSLRNDRYGGSKNTICQKALRSPWKRWRELWRSDELWWFDE